MERKNNHGKTKFLKHNWLKVFKNEPSKISGRQPLKHFT